MMLRAGVLAGVIFAALTSTAFAHHSFAMFDHSKKITLVGDVKVLDFENPHSWLKIVTQADQGQATVWSFEMGPVAILKREGWTPKSVEAGDRVTVKFHPMRDGSSAGQLISSKHTMSRIPAADQIRNLLVRPHLASELTKAIGVSRQAVEHILRRLVRSGRVKRVRVSHETGRYIYVRAEYMSLQTLRYRIPRLRQNAAAVLSLLPAETPVFSSEIGRRGEFSHLILRNSVSLLEEFDLVETARIRSRVLVRLTQRGREHPQYNTEIQNATPAKKCNLLQALLQIYVRGEARTRDISPVISKREGKRIKSVASYVQRLKILNYVEPIISCSAHPAYRVTRK